MKVSEFISNYKNHPVLFVGTGMSLRYLDNSYTWDGLLSKISYDLMENDEFYLDLKSKYQIDGKYQFEKIADELELIFNKILTENKPQKFKAINEFFYEKMRESINYSRFKIYIASIFEDLEFKNGMLEEVKELKKIRKNIGSIITTNYDPFIEKTFEFNPLIGNNILLSNPYGSVYKIHGCYSDPGKIIITESDYVVFMEKYELIRAQLLSLFIHNPIIFIGYRIGDENIKNILKTIFTYIEPNSEQADKIRSNFLLIEYEGGSDSEEITDHDIDLEGFSTIRINKIKTDNFSAIYDALSDLHLPVSAMDVRKVQDIVTEIYAGGSIEVNVTEDLDTLNNSDKIIAIGSKKSIQYQFMTTSEIMSKYFNIMDESNNQILSLIDKCPIQSGQYFPIYGFSCIKGDIKKEGILKTQQESKLKYITDSMSINGKNKHTQIDQILNDDAINISSKNNALVWSTLEDNIDLEEVEAHLRNFEDKESTEYRKLLCAYDYKKYNK